ncbi:reverse transcriptase/maturase family protein [Chryseobacterium sp. R2A-55]|uniref:reverse transcriptase/maturase family protein n=1 Tax=Chryseobacterium sp. R2A-55 TaxID=2744445 RepID=UPI001F3DB8AB|nr:reverse transcriptase/maturase family protein [Chryseobacterium sp. R2A-55]
MKRLNNLFEKIISIENLTLADLKAQKGKRETYGVIQHNKNSENNILKLHDMLISKTYKTSQYDVFKVFEPKERDVYRLPYFPDRICHHAVMNVLEPIFVAVFTADSYSCIKGRGIHKASFNLRKALKNTDETTYCLKLDIKKFYPNIDHDILKALLRKKFKDADLLWLLDEIIDSAPGLPIGNYLSQYLANFYLTYFDHWIKEQLRIKYYFRYADDVVILHKDKEYLHEVLKLIKTYFNVNLKLEVKENWQVFPVEKRGINFVGYVHYHTHVLLRKSIKKRFAKMLKRKPRKESIASYCGWLKHCNSKHLTKKLLADVQL